MVATRTKSPCTRPGSGSSEAFADSGQRSLQAEQSRARRMGIHAANVEAVHIATQISAAVERKSSAVVTALECRVCVGVEGVRAAHGIGEDVDGAAKFPLQDGSRFGQLGNLAVQGQSAEYLVVMC